MVKYQEATYCLCLTTPHVQTLTSPSSIYVPPQGDRITFHTHTQEANLYLCKGKVHPRTGHEGQEGE
jgi:hypothetical protein